MDAIRNVSSSIQAVNAILEMTNSEVIEAAEKHVKVAVELAVGCEVGKGQLIDLVA